MPRHKAIESGMPATLGDVAQRLDRIIEFMELVASGLGLPVEKPSGHDLNHKPVDPATRQPGQPWSYRDAAAYLGVSAAMLATAKRVGTLKTFKIGQLVFIADEDVQRITREGLRTKPVEDE